MITIYLINMRGGDDGSCCALLIIPINCDYGGDGCVFMLKLINAILVSISIRHLLLYLLC